ncbi:MAG: hypothetical protein IJ875_07535, partial [Solobacterium sp.]|nr:hypothetical protein [Solobacterium sp.]
EEDLMEVKVPKAYIMDYVFTQKEDIVGKYSDIQGRIPAGSLLYKSMLYDFKSIPDGSAALLKENQIVYVTEIDLATLGSIQAGNRVDIYVNMTKDKEVITDRLFSHVRVLAIKDHKGLSIKDEESNGIPYFIELAIDRDDVSLLSKAEALGKIRLFMTPVQNNTRLEAIVEKESDIYSLLNKNIMEENKAEENKVEEKKEEKIEEKKEEKKVEKVEPKEETKVEENKVEESPINVENPIESPSQEG